MKILFILKSIPFPPRQGVELPVSHIIKKLSKYHTVDILVVAQTKEDESDYFNRMSNTPGMVRHVNIIKAKKRPLKVSYLREIIGISPVFFIDNFDENDLIKISNIDYYDVAWCTPFGVMGILHACKKVGIFLSKAIAIGHNDAKVSLYWDGFKQLFRGRIGIDWIRVFQGLRIPWIWMYERRYLSGVDLIHVQTKLEKKRMLCILKKNTKTKIIFASNGINKSLKEVEPRIKKNNRILFMTHLTGVRGKEAEWFLLNVWPDVLISNVNAELLVVGLPPRKGSKLNDLIHSSVKICGFVDDLTNLMRVVDILVVPTLHGTGWVNRLSDGLVAGLPIVASPESLATINNIDIGVNAFEANTKSDFVNGITKLLSSNKLREDMSINNKNLAKHLYTWDDATAKIEINIKNISLSNEN
jgi:glycosyltransferase involved in cell wall biosynthesis